MGSSLTKTTAQIQSVTRSQQIQAAARLPFAVPPLRSWREFGGEDATFTQAHAVVDGQGAVTGA